MNDGIKTTIGFKTPELERIELLEAEILNLKSKLSYANNRILELESENNQLKSGQSQARPVVVDRKPWEAFT